MHTKIIDFCLDNKDLPESEFINSLIKILENHTGYDKSKKTIDKACKINPDEFMDRLSKVLKTNSDEDVTVIDLIIEMENNFTKKELAYYSVTGMLKWLVNNE